MSNNVILDELPRSYLSDEEQLEISIALTEEMARYCSVQEQHLKRFEFFFLDPVSCYAHWLDTIAEWTGWGSLWSPQWSEIEKRELLLNTDRLWATRGSRIGFELIVAIFRLQARLDSSSAGGWILGVTTLPADLLVDPFQYTIEVPVSYTPDTYNYKLVAFIRDNFLPCWGEFEIKTNPNFVFINY
ncbi:phage tail protein [Moorena sp. SIO3A2]|uniref:phage tail protein n=1 Tax=Moorena sp. SIO3A2 TaxID=2607841 RepID=UPI0013BA0F19|nr:phage tail protein [Moorena sp. SIO3A2]NER90367.1 hypothetical protein [Moorena sp. SIO3A2]